MIARCLAPFAALAFAALPSAPLIAQEGDGTIVVTGEREAEPIEVRRQAKAITPRGGEYGEPIARFQTPICVAVWGLEQDSAQYIIDRVYFNAERLGVATQEGVGCTANIFALFVADPDREISELFDADHFLLRGLDYWDRKKLRSQTGPVRSWNAVVKRDSTGAPAFAGNPPVFIGTQTSRLNGGIQMDLLMSVVMIDSAAIADLDGVAVADYVTMRSLARTKLPDEDRTTLNTILTLFNSGDANPIELTSFDEAYLSKVYSTKPNQSSGRTLRGLPGIIEEIEARED